MDNPEEHKPPEQQMIELQMLVQKAWTVLLIGLYMVSLYSVGRITGLGNDAPGQEILMNVQRVFFFGLMGAGFLLDIVQMRMDRKKAYLFLSLSLILGGFADIVATLQYKFLSIFI